MPAAGETVTFISAIPSEERTSSKEPSIVGVGDAPVVPNVTVPDAKEKRGVPTSFTSPVRVISAASVTYSPAGMVRATEMSLFSSGAETV